jgi:hypothetical protein
MSNFMRIFNKLILLLFISHFTILFIYLVGDLEYLPKKYNSYTEWTNHYINPFFEQRWGMFAPNPPVYNMSIYVQYIIPVGNHKKYSIWYDIHSPVINQNNNSYFSVNQRLLKYFHGCAMEVYLAGFTDTTKLPNNVINDAIRKTYGYRSLRRYARIVYNNQFQQFPSKQVRFRLKFVNVYFPAFIDRKKDYQTNKGEEYSVLETATDKL